jgi:hypothetical protein
MLDPILFWGPVIVGGVWSVLALHNLFYLLDADNSTPAFRVLFNRALVSAALLPIFWFVLLHTTRKLPAGWPVLAVEGAHTAHELARHSYATPFADKESSDRPAGPQKAPGDCSGSCCFSVLL